MVMYITTVENLASHFNKRGFILISSLISIFVVSVSTLAIVQMSSRFAEKWREFYILSTQETLIRNFEQVASSPTNILASISDQQRKDIYLENGKLRRCLQLGRCRSMNEYRDFSLFDITKGKVISNGRGIRYDIAGGICTPSSGAYCPFTISSQVKAFCWGDRCDSTKGSTGLAIKYAISLEKEHGENKIENFIYIQRSQLKNATKDSVGCLKCPIKQYGFPKGPHILGVRSNLRTNCVTNKVKKKTLYIIIP